MLGQEVDWLELHLDAALEELGRALEAEAIESPVTVGEREAQVVGEVPL